MKLILKKGATSQRVGIFLQDTSKSDGSGLTGIVAANLTCYRWREDDGNANATQLSLSGGTRGTWSSGGFVEKDATNMPGLYELGLDNNGLVTGAEWVIYMLKGATNMAPVLLEIELVDVDLFDAVHFGLSALPNAAANAANGLHTIGTGAGQIQVDGSGNAFVDVKEINTVSCTGRDLGASVLLANPPGIRKNATLTNFMFVMFDSSGLPKTGLTGFTAQRSIDGAAFGALGTVAEVGNGVYMVTLGTGDTNGDVITYYFAATGAVPTIITIKTVVP